MNLIYLLEREEKFYKIFSRDIDENTELKAFSSINDLSESLEENEPDLLLVFYDFQSDNTLENILSFTQSLLIDNILLTMAEVDHPLNQYYDSSLTFLDTTDYIRMTLERHLSRRARVKSLHQSIKDSNILTEKTLTLAGDLGEIQQIYYSFSSIKSLDELVGAIFNIIDHYHVKVALLVQHNGRTLFYTNTDKLSELDTDILKDKRNGERFVEFGVRTQVNYESISVLIKNMPRKNSEQYIRIKDNMVSLLSACDTLVKLFEIFKMQEGIGVKIKQSSSVIREMVEQAYESQIRVMNSAILEIEDKFYAYGLSESQEKEVTDILHKTETDTEHLVFLTKGIVNILNELQTDALKVIKPK